jgi:hypothetical protein
MQPASTTCHVTTMGESMFKQGDIVTIDRIGEPAGREWMVTEPLTYGDQWAMLQHRTSNDDIITTSVPVKRLRAVGATTQPATSPITAAEPEVDIEAQAEAAAREVPATGGGLDGWARRQQLAGRSLRTQADRTVEAALAATTQPATSPITAKELEARIAEHPLDNLGTLNEVLIDRIVRRAKYDALRMVLAEVAFATENAESVCDAMLTFDDVRRMVNAAARASGTIEPWRPEASS